MIKSTTGHEWDGIKELNTPLPRWRVLTFYACIVWALGYWFVYPAWPLLRGNTTGILHYSSRADVAVELANLEKIRGEKMVTLGAASLADIEKDPALLALARARGKTVFGDNCAPCHGSGGAGAKGFPNLNDDDWLWGGTLDQIMQTIQFGARSGHAKTHESQMLAFGKDGTLKTEQIVTVANYVRSLSGLSTSQGYDATAGAKIFAENCAACHGDAGTGNPTRSGSMVPMRLPSSKRSPTAAPASCRPGWTGSIPPRSRRWRYMCTRSVEGSDRGRGREILDIV